MINLKYLSLLFAVSVFAGCATKEHVANSQTTVRDVANTRIQSFLEDMEKEEHFTGVAVVMQDGQIVHAKGYGAATIDEANEVSTAFHIASITKQFTAAATLQLAEVGSVNLDNSVNNYLPGEYRSPKWELVTLHHLLSHSSGIPDYAIARDYYDLEEGFGFGDTVDGMVREAMEKDLEFAPGSKYSYTNLGYTLLGLVIENQTDLSYARYIKDNILEPMAMWSSQIHEEGHNPTTDEAGGFRWSDEQAAYISDDTETLPATAPDAGLITTLDDFVKWVEIYRGGDQSILTKESVDAMTTQHIQMGRGGSVDAYGYGLGVGDRLIAHSGHIVGFRSQFILDRQTDTLIVVFSNNAANNMERIAFGLLTIVLAPTS